MLLLDVDHSLLFDEETMRSIDKPTLLVERVAGRPRFMTMRAHLRLKRLVSINGVVPVTKRTMEEYQQLELFQIDAPPKWAIIEDGKILLKEGKVDRRYENWLRQFNKETSLDSILEYLIEMEQVSIDVYPSETLSSAITLPHEPIQRTTDEAVLLEELFRKYETT
ncbi:hypothetical protein [Exiguobacterium acetylicum]|uniref:hypothetical protein n=1 Tax=Exiguobacterium acetylicum TaxID=41170 RepID=UPI000680E132|nr:hypothetical protein [Exiguobacterium acetylicum]KNH36500.1 hypothetical protein ACS74_05530 [Exiguobacterium acetylicum]